MTKLRIVVVLIALMIVVSAAITIELSDRLSHHDPGVLSVRDAGVRGLIVQPDDGRAPILEEIDSATDTIDLMIYLLTDDTIIDALIDAERRGVDVRILLEQHPFGGFGDPEVLAIELKEAGAEVKWSGDSFTFTHAKTMIVDRSVVAIMNFNLSRSSFERNREFGVISTKPGDVREFQSIFDADWNSRIIEVNGPLTVSPDESRDEIVGLIDNARVTIDIYAEVVRDRNILDRIEAAEVRGVSVRVILSPDDEPDAQRILATLRSIGVEVRFSGGLYIHAKAILVDGEFAFVGSQNLTQTSLDKNREVGIIVTESEIVGRLSKTFDSDFATATSNW